MEQIIGSAANAPTDDLIKDTDTQNFMADVIEASNEVPVIVDFWAPWCGPCRQLGPALEKVVQAQGGKVRMVKINVDENQQLAQQMRIQSIPAVYAFANGQPVDGFMGALPESQIQAFVKKVIEQAGAGAASPVEEALEQAKDALAKDDTESAVAIFAQILQHEPENVAALAGIAQAYIRLGHIDEAGEVLSQIADDKKDEPEVKAAYSALELAKKAGEAGDASELRDRLAANPDDHQARFDLAMSLYAQGEHTAAIDALLEIVKRERGWNEDAARKQLLEFFEALGPTNPATIHGRGKLSSLLFS